MSRDRLGGLCLVGAVLAALAVAQPARAAPADADGPIASPEPGWPQWRGPRRDGVSDAKGLLQEWPEGGPPLLWKTSGLGRGWSSPIVTGGAIYITGDVGDELRVFAFDLDGKPKWQSENGRAWKGQHPGARACCAASEGRIYHMNAHGRLACLDAGTGREVWAANVLERFEGKNLTWAISECVLVDGANVLVTPGGKKAFMAALDSKTGATAWASEPMPDPETERTGYGSPLLFRRGGRRLLAAGSLRSLVCVDADAGKVLWTFPKRTKYEAACATPLYWQGCLFYSLPSKSGSVMLRLATDGGVQPEKVWECRMDNLSGGVVACDGYLYGSGEDNRGWYCLDARTGEEKYCAKDLAQSAVLWADGRLYCLGERGEMVLVKPGPDALHVVGRFRLTDGAEPDAWAHPVVLDGRLYLRYHDDLYCYDVRQR